MTGRDLLAWLEASPQHLDLDVVLIGEDFVDTSEGILRTIELDRFEEYEPMVICLDVHPPRPASKQGITSSMFSNDTRES